MTSDAEEEGTRFHGPHAVLILPLYIITTLGLHPSAVYNALCPTLGRYPLLLLSTLQSPASWTRPSSHSLLSQAQAGLCLLPRPGKSALNAGHGLTALVCWA